MGADVVTGGSAASAKTLKPEDPHQRQHVYMGEYYNGCKHGLGIETFGNGCQYTGEYHLDTRHGRGEYVFFNGDVYEGQFAHHKINGYGKLVSVADGHTYEGMW